MGKRGNQRVYISGILEKRNADSFQGRGGRGGRGGGRGRGRGGGQRSQRADYDDIPKTNSLFEKYYNELNLVPDADRESFWDAMRRELPNSFRFTGSKG
jgi:multisite-specific tRNA:(cytosine-C5)-methyltransferase